MDTVKLGVNIDHVATLRQARGGAEPEPVVAAGIAELAGADGITAHLREDRRHMQDRDIHLLRETVQTRLNLEMACSDEIIEIALKIGPDQITLVPERREERTTEGGLDVAASLDRVRAVTERFAQSEITVSLFIAPNAGQVEAAADTGARFVELHTGEYANAADEAERYRRLAELKQAAELAQQLGLRVNAGHGLNYQNVRDVAAIPQVEELNIGHSIICRAVFAGLGQAVREMKVLIANK